MLRGSPDPFAHLALLRERINRLFEIASTRTDFDSGDDDASRWSPLVDLHETDEQVVLVAEVPGLSMKDLEVKVADSRLTLKGKRRPPASGRHVVHHRVERSHGAFSRTFQLSASIDGDGVTADYRQGLLRVVLPKRRSEKARSIRVQTG